MKTKTTFFLKRWCFIPTLLMSFMVSAQGIRLDDLCEGTDFTPFLKEVIATYPLTDLSDATGNNNTEILPGINISSTNCLCLDSSIIENFGDLEGALADPDLLSVIDSFDFTPVEDNFDPNNFGLKLEFKLSYSPPEDANPDEVVVLDNDPYLNYLGLVYNYISEQIGVLLANGDILYADVSVPLNQWHTVEVRHFLGIGGFLYLNGTLVLAVNNSVINFEQEELDLSQFDVSNLTLGVALNFVTSYASLSDAYESCMRNIEVYKCVPEAIEVPSITENCTVSLEAPEAWDICSGTIVATTTDPTEYAEAGDYIVNWSFVTANGIGELILPQNVTVIGIADSTVMWTGVTNTDWTNAGNWENNNAPSLSLNTNINIPTGLTNYPVLTSGQNLFVGTCSNVTIESGASLTVNPNAVLTNNGTVEVATGGTVTFESDPSGTAYLGAGTGDFTGDFTVERYIPAKRAFRFLSTAVTTSDFILNNWQKDTHITGSTTDGENGFDGTVTGNPSMFTYDNVAQTWNAIPNTDATNLTSGTPYRLMVRGDRTIDLNNNAPPATPTTLVSKGALTAENAGSSTFALNATADGFSFIGNPFQAQVDMKTVLQNNSNNVIPVFYWVWDPTLGIRGAYVTVDFFNPVANPTAGEQNQFLQAGQACFVQTNTESAASVTFTQASKNSSELETKVFRSTSNKSASSSRAQLSIKLYESSAYIANMTPADGVSVYFDDAGNNDVDAFDAPDFTNLDENLATNNNGNLLSIESRATPFIPDEIQLEINTYRNTDYVLEANAQALKGDIPLLLDTYLNETTEIAQNGMITYAYTINPSIPASFAGDRFKIIFEKTLSVTNKDLNEILLYPNPTNTGNIYLNIPQGINDLEVTIYNALGARVFQTKDLSTGNKVSVNTSFIKNVGVYFVKLSSRGSTTTKKLIIN